MNSFYLFNFQGTNGVLTRNGNSEFSCPDQFAVQLGAAYNLSKHFSLYLGLRSEGVPSSDLIGSDEGYRRPGYVMSVEPGVVYSFKNITVIATLPIAYYRNRTQSYIDKQRTLSTGNYRHGDAAFADYLVNLSFNYRLSTNKTNDQHLSIPKAIDK